MNTNEYIYIYTYIYIYIYIYIRKQWRKNSAFLNVTAGGAYAQGIAIVESHTSYGSEQ